MKTTNRIMTFRLNYVIYCVQRFLCPLTQRKARIVSFIKLILFSVFFFFVFFFTCSPVPRCVPVSKGRKTHSFKKQRKPAKNSVTKKQRLTSLIAVDKYM